MDKVNYTIIFCPICNNRVPSPGAKDRVNARVRLVLDFQHMCLNLSHGCRFDHFYVKYSIELV